MKFLRVTCRTLMLFIPLAGCGLISNNKRTSNKHQASVYSAAMVFEGGTSDARTVLPGDEYKLVPHWTTILCFKNDEGSTKGKFVLDLKSLGTPLQVKAANADNDPSDIENTSPILNNIEISYEAIPDDEGELSFHFKPSGTAVVDGQEEVLDSVELSESITDLFDSHFESSAAYSWGIQFFDNDVYVRRQLQRRLGNRDEDVGEYLEQCQEREISYIYQQL